MANPYPSLISGAAGLIKTFGYAATLQAIDQSYSYPITIVMDSYDPRYVDGDLVQFLDKRCLIAAKGLAQAPRSEYDRIVEAGNTHRIITVKPLSPGGQPIYYECQLRLLNVD